MICIKRSFIKIISLIISINLDPRMRLLSCIFCTFLINLQDNILSQRHEWLIVSIDHYCAASIAFPEFFIVFIIKYLFLCKMKSVINLFELSEQSSTMITLLTIFTLSNL